MRPAPQAAVPQATLPQAALNLQPLLAVLPPLAIGLGRVGVHLVKWESHMIRDTLESIVWATEKPRCRGHCRDEWHVCCVPPCHGCR
jgi:hypothetical protein